VGEHTSRAEEGNTGPSVSSAPRGMSMTRNEVWVAASVEVAGLSTSGTAHRSCYPAPGVPGEHRVHMTAEDLSARIRRLEAMTLVRPREGQLLRTAQDPLLYAERRDYLKAIGSATVALDEARVVLAEARQRLERQG
jgi:hypothetical protein